MLSSLFHY